MQSQFLSRFGTAPEMLEGFVVVVFLGGDGVTWRGTRHNQLKALHHRDGGRMTRNLTATQGKEMIGLFEISPVPSLCSL